METRKFIKVKRHKLRRKYPNSLLELAKIMLKPYELQHNTGNVYEIYEIFTILRKMGLTSEEVTQLDTIVTTIIDNTKTISQPNMKKMFELIKKLPTGAGLVMNGKKVISLRNATQDDSDSYTSDIIYIFEDNTQQGESISGGSIKKDKTITKCISNPTCTRFGCIDDDIKSFKDIEKNAVQQYKIEIGKKYGTDEGKWPSRIKTHAQINATTEVASKVVERYNGLSDERKKSIMEDILYLKANTKPADILCIIHPEFKKITRFHIISSKFTDGWVPLFKQRAFNVEMYINDLKIAETQVKFNNGVYHKGRTSSLTSSWNAYAYIDKLFNLEELKF
jgi:hypothetical protein